MGTSPVTLNAAGKPQILGANGQPVTTPSAPTAAAPNPVAAPNFSSVSPTYMSQLFPNGLPQAQANTVGSVPQASASTATPYTQTATGVSTQGLGPEAMIAQILGAEQPIYGQQSQALKNNLASAGIVGGSMAGAQNDLSMSQLQQSLAAIAPYEQTAQQTRLGANEFNAGAQNTAAGANASALNSNSQFNAGALNNMSQYNTSNLVNTNNLNSSILNANSQFNTNNALNAGQVDANASNTILGQLLGFQNQDYTTQLNNQEALQQAQMTGVNAAGAPVYQQPSQPSFGNLAGAFGSAAAASPKAAGGGAFGSSLPANWTASTPGTTTMMGQ